VHRRSGDPLRLGAHRLDRPQRPPDQHPGNDPDERDEGRKPDCEPLRERIDVAGDLVDWGVGSDRELALSGLDGAGDSFELSEGHFATRRNVDRDRLVASAPAVDEFGVQHNGLPALVGHLHARRSGCVVRRHGLLGVLSLREAAGHLVQQGR
jgi:hypothetical protein